MKPGSLCYAAHWISFVLQCPEEENRIQQYNYHARNNECTLYINAQFLVAEGLCCYE